MSEFMDYERFAFVFAHPDDEIYTVATIKQLATIGKCISVAYITNGDYASPEMAETREHEVSASMELLEVNPGTVQHLGFSERTLFDHADEVVEAVSCAIASFEPEVVVGHDYEGGHNAHDFASFCGWHAARGVNAGFWAFPAYHGPVETRRWNRFVAGRTYNYRLHIGHTGGALKKAVMNAHRSHMDFFDKLMISPDRPAFLAREELRRADDIDFTERPTEPIGYEPMGSTARFDQLQAVIQTYL